MSTDVTTEQHLDADTPDNSAWVGLSQRSLGFIEKLTGRNDVTLRVFEGDKDGTIAWWIRHEASMHVNGTRVFPDGFDHLDSINLGSPTSQRENPLYVAAVTHESSHAKHTVAYFKDYEGVPDKVMYLTKMLEESRCERKMLEEHPQYREFLKTMMFEVILPKDMAKHLDEAASISLITTFILAYGRHLNAVLSEDDIKVLSAFLEEKFGTEKYDGLKSIIEEFIVLEDYYDDGKVRHYAVAQKIIDLFGPDLFKNMSDTKSGCAYHPGDPDQNPDPDADPGQSGPPMDSDEPGDGEDEDGEPGDGSGSDAGGGSGGEEDENADSQGAGGGSDDPEGDEGTGSGDEPEKPSQGVLDILKKISGILQEMDEDADETRKRIATGDTGTDNDDDAVKEDENAEDAYAKNVQGTRPESIANYHDKQTTDYQGHYKIRQHPITNHASDYARYLKKQLDKAQYRAQQKIKNNSMTPPGRLRVKESMNLQRQMSMGQTVTATPWSQTRRRDVENPKINLVVLPDFSLSMDDYQYPVSEFVWAFGQAVRQLQGKVTAVGWCGYPMLLMGPGLSYNYIPVATTDQFSTGLPKAVLAADKIAGLSHDNGVKMAVVITDAEIPHANVKDYLESMQNLVDNGVKVVWIDVRPHWRYSRNMRKIVKSDLPKGVTHVEMPDPDKFAQVVAPKIIEALEQS